MPANKPGKKEIPIFLDEPLYREIKVYAAETDQKIQDVVRPLTKDFEQGVLKLISQIKEMNRQARLRRDQEDEDAKIAIEHPILVTGKPEDPVGHIAIEQTA